MKRSRAKENGVQRNGHAGALQDQEARVPPEEHKENGIADVPAAGDGAGIPAIEIDPEFSRLNPPLSPTELDNLEGEIQAERRCREKLVVWVMGTRQILLDGHNRLKICKEFGIPFEVERLEFASRAEARAWITAHQRGRRNLFGLGLSYHRGQRYLAEKHDHGGARKNMPSSGHDDNLKDLSAEERRTADLLGTEYGVSASTICRDGKFACAVEQIAANCGDDLRQVILSENGPMKTKHMLLVAAMDADAQRQFFEDLRAGKLPEGSGEDSRKSWFLVPPDPEKLAAAVAHRLLRKDAVAACKALSRDLGITEPQERDEG